MQLRNYYYYFSRDFSDIVGASKKSKADEWAQGFISNYRSGYTPGPVGFGLDALGLPGLNATLRYVRGSDVRTGRGFEGEDSERDIDLSYTVRNGPLKDVSLRLRHAVAHANYRTDIDENRVVVSYTMKLI